MLIWKTSAGWNFAYESGTDQVIHPAQTEQNSEQPHFVWKNHMHFLNLMHTRKHASVIFF